MSLSPLAREHLRIDVGMAMARDLHDGRLRRLEDYQARHSRFTDVVAEEFALLLSEAARATPMDSRIPVPRSGTSVGPYVLIDELGRGGQGTVFRARDTWLDRVIALKVLTADRAGIGADVARLGREALLTARLDHPGICPIYDVGSDGNCSYVAMKLVEGRTLADEVARERKRRAESSPGSLGAPAPQRALSIKDPGVARALRIVEDAARAVHAAHEAGVIHRDVKPGNIMITPDDAVVVLDFGLAKEVESTAPSLTLTGDLVGTPNYIAPEWLRGGAGRHDRRADIWALGVTLFEALWLERPFDGPTRHATYHAILEREPFDPARSRQRCSRDLQVVLSTALSKDLDRRYATAEAFAEDLRRLRHGEPVLARRTGTFGRFVRWLRRNPALGAAIGVGSLLLILSVASLIHLYRTLVKYECERDVSRIAQLRLEAETLFPPGPEMVPALRAWIRRADEVVARLPEHEEALRSLAMRGQVVPVRRRGSVDGGTFEVKFGDPDLQSEYNAQVQLVGDIRALVNSREGRGPPTSIRARLAFAETVEGATWGRYLSRWESAQAATESPSGPYGGFRLSYQLGLIPIGPDPHSHLWEFVHLATAAAGTDPIPARDGDGRLIITEDTGLVFVLIPGGKFQIGAQPPSPDEPEDGPNRDRRADSYEGPVRTVTVAPFFLSKYEMTQAQWLRATGSNPAMYSCRVEFEGSKADLRHPVELVSWNDCQGDRGCLPRLGLILPTEAQWEYACRAGTTTPWWPGQAPERLAMAANLQDLYARSKNEGWSFEPWDDGWFVHAPVGSLAANAFGLHDVHGNVAEWCLDGFIEGYALDVWRRADGLRDAGDAPAYRVFRGGSYFTRSTPARSSYRDHSDPTYKQSHLGVRPARPIDP